MVNGASPLQLTSHNATRWLFPVAFSFACLLFWWLPSILLRYLQLDDPIDSWTFVVSAAALGVFLLGYSLFRVTGRPWKRIRTSTIDWCEQFAYSATKLIAIPATLLGIRFGLYRAGVSYGQGENIPLAFQAVLYTHMFFAYMFLGSVQDLSGRNRRRVLLSIALVLFPRLIISLHWGRFFLGQTIVVILFIALARGWVRLSPKRWVQLFLLAAFIFFVPAWSRGDAFFGYDTSGQPTFLSFIKNGSTLHFFQEYRNTLHSECPPLLVSMTSKVIPYSLLGVCTIQVGDKKVTATLDNLLTRLNSNDLATGTGSIYIFELYISGGITAVILGSVLFGMSCRWFVESIGQRSLFSGIWAECLARSLMAPRGTLGYEYERIPSLLFATLAVIILCRCAEILCRQPMRPAGTGESRSLAESAIRS